MRVLAVLCLITCTLAWTAPALAADPEAAAGVRRGNKYVGEPFGVFVRAEGFGEDPQPECLPGKTPDGVTLRFIGVRPQVSSFVQLFNGQRTVERKVTYTYEFEAIAQRADDYTFPPFTVKQGATQASTQSLVVPVLSVPIEKTMSIALELPPGPYAPGERVPVEIVWSFVGDINVARGVTIRSEFLDTFSFDDSNAGMQDLLLPISGSGGIVKVKATMEKIKIQGQDGVRLRAKRIWRVEKPGTFEFAPIAVSMQRVTQWRRSFFGDREPTASKHVRAEGQPLRITVESLPDEGRPASFAGAVGRGFSLEASADRTVVRAGDPIRLTLTLRGDGNLDAAGLPPLTSGGGLDPANFRQADAEATGQIQDDAKVFEVTVRVEHDRVARVPPIQYGWWNPKLKRYETTQSKPIALQVGEAQVVSAKDVVSAGPTADNATDASTTAPPRSAAQIASGADLALVEDLDQLRAAPTGSTLPWILYALSAAAITLALFTRRRAQVDPAIRARGQAASRAADAIGKARSMPAVEGAKHVSETLRSLRAAHADVPRPATYDDVLSKLDAIAYRPSADGGGLPADLVDAARQAALEIGR